MARASGIFPAKTTEPTCPEDECADYYRVEDAQRDLDAEPQLCADLDPNGDGTACNEPGNNVTTCPTTAACGCSTLNKSECGSRCCQWVVAEGCGCAPGVPR